ncbi:hypothetical protein [Pleionea sp. CnH1-48]|uniref:hypothetical protein n=1 Tax=Pleionea sp. CnH1-48 TaxID=2954494 RepID=UPI002097A353|nr:hypothetical protein [Pleionea sp. CnH1-48]MCO7224003.1 hypothetical protein [Pleionea sp. CnH1-48]
MAGVSGYLGIAEIYCDHKELNQSYTEVNTWLNGARTELYTLAVTASSEWISQVQESLQEVDERIQTLDKRIQSKSCFATDSADNQL